MGDLEDVTDVARKGKILINLKIRKLERRGNGGKAARPERLKKIMPPRGLKGRVGE